MSLTPTTKSNWSSMAMGAGLAVLVGLALWGLPLGEGWVHAGYDLPCLFTGPATPDNVVIVSLDQASHDALAIPHGQWPRRLHAQLLDHLRAEQCRLVVFDVVFMGASAPEEDAALREAIRRHGRVVLAGVRAPNPDANFASEYTWRPTNFLSADTHWGVVGARVDRDLVARRLFTGLNTEPSLAWAAAEHCDARLPDLAAANRERLWMRYYGPAETLGYLSYHRATNQPAGFFRDKIVFVGGKPSPLFLDEKADVFRTPFTKWTGQLTPGVELVATMFLNLVHHDAVRRMPAWVELSALLLAGVVGGAGLRLARPWPALILALTGGLAVALMGLWFFSSAGLWWAWTVVAGAQIPCALAWSLLHRRFQLPQAAPGTQAATAPVQPGAVASPGLSRPNIPQHTLVRRIGDGSYGDVWLARDVVGRHHAVKVVYRSRFGADPKPFDREYRGISAYAPISLAHPSLLPVLFVGRCEAEGYFYYTMELGDDRNAVPSAAGKPTPAFDPETYQPRNLEKDLEVRKYLPMTEVLDLAVPLAGALAYLHQHGLAHRDIKPSNIVFVKGVPKLADIGLVMPFATEQREASYVGTEGYIAPEGPGTPAADLFSLGVVLYRMSTGQAAKQYPELPETLYKRPNYYASLELIEIIRTVCTPYLDQRCPSAAALHQALVELRSRL